MINSILLQILKSPNGKEFINWYVSKYPDVNVFQNLEFEKQIGVFLTYLEQMWGFSVIADNTGYITYYTSHFDSTSSKAILKDRFKTNNFYHIHSFEDASPKTAMYYYEIAILHLFENLDIPF